MEQRFVITIDDERRLKLPERVPFAAGEPLHLLWDGKVLQVSRAKPRKLDDAYAKVQEDAGKVMDTNALQNRLAQERERQRRKFDEALGQFFKDEEKKTG